MVREKLSGFFPWLNTEIEGQELVADREAYWQGEHRKKKEGGKSPPKRDCQEVGYLLRGKKERH